MKPTRRMSVFVLIFVLLLTNSGITALADSVLTMPAALQIIEEEAFYGSTSIDKVVLPDNVKEIREKAFANSTLSEINLPGSITFIDPTAFDGCSSVIARTYPGSYAEGYAKEHENLENHTIPTNTSTETTVNADGSISTKMLETWTETTVNADDSVTVTDYVKETVTIEGENGMVKTITESQKSETTGNVENEDGSLTDTTIVSGVQTVTETLSDANGNRLSATETRTEQEKTTAITSLEMNDGTVEETIETNETEKVTETVTDARGNVTETVSKTIKDEFVILEFQVDGSAEGSSSSITTVTDGDDNKLSETVILGSIEIRTDESGAIITTTTATTTIKDADGNVLSVIKTTTTEDKTPGGSTGVIVKDEAGNVLSQETTISQEEYELAMAENRPIQVPLTIDPDTLSPDGELPPIKVNLPPALYDKDGDGTVSPGERPKIEIQVTVGNATVVIAEIGPDGTLRIKKDCYEG